MLFLECVVHLLSTRKQTISPTSAVGAEPAMEYHRVHAMLGLVANSVVLVVAQVLPAVSVAKTLQLAQHSVIACLGQTVFRARTTAVAHQSICSSVLARAYAHPCPSLSMPTSWVISTNRMGTVTWIYFGVISRDSTWDSQRTYRLNTCQSKMGHTSQGKTSRLLS